jgi:hypothetical protein
MSQSENNIMAVVPGDLVSQSTVVAAAAVAAGPPSANQA